MKILKFYTLSIFPPKEKILRCFNYFNINYLKFVITGQECYYGNDQVNGLCFNIDDTLHNLPLLTIILKDCNISRTSSDFTDLVQRHPIFKCFISSIRKNTTSHMEH